MRAEKPMVFHFLVCPHSPASGALISESGTPVLTDYAQVDWSGLAKSARDVIEKHTPKSVKLYVADDAVDVMDVLNISTDTGRQGSGPGFETRVQAVFSRISMDDMRAGITKIAEKHPEIHMNSPIRGRRPPLGALIMSLKFTNGSQVIDYLTGSSMALFGAPAHVMGIEGYEPQASTGKMPAFLASWLRAQFGVVYGAECTVVAIARTFSEV